MPSDLRAQTASVEAPTVHMVKSDLRVFDPIWSAATTPRRFATRCLSRCGTYRRSRPSAFVYPSKIGFDHRRHGDGRDFLVLRLTSGDPAAMIPGRSATWARLGGAGAGRGAKPRQSAERVRISSAPRRRAMLCRRPSFGADGRRPRCGLSCPRSGYRHADRSRCGESFATSVSMSEILSPD